MSRAVKSDGEVNKAMRELALGRLTDGLSMGDREDVGRVLTDEDKLKQCDYQTLLLAGAAYIDQFGDKNWAIQKHIEIKAQQSEKYRKYKAGSGAATESGSAPAKATPSPLERLLSR